MDAGKDDGTFGSISDALCSAAWVGQLPTIYWINDWLTPLLGNHLGIAARHGSLRNFAAQEIQSRQTRRTHHDDMLRRLSQVQKDKPVEMNEASVLSMASSNIFAGSDTTAISIRAVLYHLGRNPRCKRKLVEELDSAQKSGKLSTPIKTEEAEKLPYLQACIYEGLRCHPAVGMTLPRVTPVGGFDINGTFIPEGVSRNSFH